MNLTVRNESSATHNATFRDRSNAFDITVRREHEADHFPVEVLTREAFWNLYRPGCDEHYTAHMIRGHEDFLPDLTFVAEVDGQIVGSIMYTRSWVINERSEKIETVGLLDWLYPVYFIHKEGKLNSFLSPRIEIRKNK